MGLFSQTVTTYHSSSSLILDQEAKGLIEQTIFGAVRQNRNIAEDLRTNITFGLLSKATSMYAFGKHGLTDTTNGYYLGLPEGNLSYSPSGSTTALKITIEKEINKKIVIASSLLDKNNPTQYAHEFMQNNRGWESSTDIISAPPFDPAGEIVYYDSSVIAGTNLIDITYSYGALTHTEQVAVTDLILEELYYYVSYYTINDKGEIDGSPKQYWRYRENLGTYPYLSIPKKEEFLVSPYYPIVPLRQFKEDLVDVEGKTAHNYLNKRRCLSFLGINIDDLANALNESPDIDDVDHAYVMLGVHLASQKEESKEYLYQFFTDLIGKSNITESEFTYWETHLKATDAPPVNILEIGDAEYRMEIAWNYIKQDIKTGTLGDIGSVFTSPINRGGEDVFDEATGEHLYSYPNSSMIIQKQVTATEYIELDIRGLVHINYVYNDNVVKTDVTLSFAEDDEKHNFIIPLNKNIATGLGAIKSYALLHDSVRMVFNSKVKTKLKWYQTTAFRVILVIVIVVVTILTKGATLKEGLALLASTELVLNVLVQVVIQQMIVSQVFAVAADIFGQEIALILSIIATAYGVGIGPDGITVAGSLADMSAMTFLNLVNQTVSGLAGLKQQKDAEAIIADSERLQEEIKAYEESINLDAENVLDLLNTERDTARKYNVVEDAPSYYYERKIHMGNIGVLSLSYPEKFADSLLNLELPYTPIRTSVY